MDQRTLSQIQGQNFSGFKTFKVQTMREPYIIRRLGTGYGGEYEDHDFQNFRLNHSIQWEPTVPGTPQQNGVAERLGQTLMRKASTILRDAGLDNRYWDEVVRTANCLRNRSLVASKSITLTKLGQAQSRILRIYESLVQLDTQQIKFHPLATQS